MLDRHDLTAAGQVAVAALCRNSTGNCSTGKRGNECQDRKAQDWNLQKQNRGWKMHDRKCRQPNLRTKFKSKIRKKLKQKVTVDANT